MKRRNFLKTTYLGSLVLSTPLFSILNGCANYHALTNKHILLMQTLLKDWCDGMPGL
jgi:hypothetical protein